MNTGKTYKRIKRRFKKKLYHFLVTLNEMDFRKLYFVCYLLLLSGMLLALTKLPTPESTNHNTLQTKYGSDLSHVVRTILSEQNQISADVIALFLPNDVSKEEVLDSLRSETMYSFYLTGTELSYLAEGAVTSGISDSTLYLDGLNYTYHKNRLPFNRVTALRATSGTEIKADRLYHVISTEDIFSLFHYIAYRSIGIMNLYPKDAQGALLSDYQEVIVTESGVPFTIGTALDFSSQLSSHSDITPSVVTMQRGFNLISLLKEPNKITICVCALFIALLALLWYIVPRLNRIRLWVRIYQIHRKKRSTHTYFYRLRKRF